MTLPDGPVVLPRIAFAKAWETERIGPPHPVTGVVDMWIEDDAAATVDELMWGALAEAGCYDLRRGRIADDFRDLLLAIAHAPREVYCFSSHRDGTDRAILAVPYDKTSLTIVVAGELMSIAETTPGLAHAVVTELPGHPPSVIREFIVPQHEYDTHGNRGGSDDYGLDTTADHTAGPVDPAENLRTIMASPRTAGHQLYAAVRNGGARRSSVPLTAVDTTGHGRVLTYLRPGPYGGMDIACGPGDDRNIASTLDNTLAGLQQ